MAPTRHQTTSIPGVEFYHNELDGRSLLQEPFTPAMRRHLTFPTIGTILGVNTQLEYSKIPRAKGEARSSDGNHAGGQSQTKTSLLRRPPIRRTYATEMLRSRPAYLPAIDEDEGEDQEQNSQTTKTRAEKSRITTTSTTASGLEDFFGAQFDKMEAFKEPGSDQTESSSSSSSDDQRHTPEKRKSDDSKPEAKDDDQTNNPFFDIVDISPESKTRSVRRDSFSESDQPRPDKGKLFEGIPTSNLALLDEFMSINAASEQKKAEDGDKSAKDDGKAPITAKDILALLPPNIKIPTRTASYFWNQEGTSSTSSTSSAGRRSDGTSPSRFQYTKALENGRRVIISHFGKERSSSSLIPAPHRGSRKKTPRYSKFYIPNRRIHTLWKMDLPDDFVDTWAVQAVKPADQPRKSDDLEQSTVDTASEWETASVADSEPESVWEPEKNDQDKENERRFKERMAEEDRRLRIAAYAMRELRRVKEPRELMQLEAMMSRLVGPKESKAIRVSLPTTMDKAVTVPVPDTKSEDGREWLPVSGYITDDIVVEDLRSTAVEEDEEEGRPGLGYSPKSEVESGPNNSTDLAAFVRETLPWDSPLPVDEPETKSDPESDSEVIASPLPAGEEKPSTDNDNSDDGWKPVTIDKPKFESQPSDSKIGASPASTKDTGKQNDRGTSWPAGNSNSRDTLSNIRTMLQRAALYKPRPRTKPTPETTRTKYDALINNLKYCQAVLPVPCATTLPSPRNSNNLLREDGHIWRGKAGWVKAAGRSKLSHVTNSDDLPDLECYCSFCLGDSWQWTIPPGCKVWDKNRKHQLEDQLGKRLGGWIARLTMPGSMGSGSGS